MEPSARAIRKAMVINRVLAACLVGTVLWNRRLFTMLFRTEPWSMLGVVVILLAVLLIGSTIGLLRMSMRGYYFAYILVPFATMFHSVPLIPVITSLLPSLKLRIASVFVLNFAFLMATFVSHRLVRHSSRSGNRGAWPVARAPGRRKRDAGEDKMRLAREAGGARG